MILSFQDQRTRKAFVDNVAKERKDIADRFVLLDNSPVVVVNGLDSAQESWVALKIEPIGIAEPEIEFERFGFDKRNINRTAKRAKKRH